MADPLDERLARLSAAPVPPLAPAAAVRTRGDQRRARRRGALATAATALVVVGGVALARGGSTLPDSLQPAPFATGAPAPTPDHPSATAAPTSWSLAGAFLPAARAVEAEQPGWAVVEPYEPEQAPLADPCGDGSVPMSEAVRESGERAMASEREAGGSSLAQEVYRYSSAPAAEDAFRGYADRYDRCRQTPDPNGPEGMTITFEIVDRAERPDGGRLLVRRLPCTDGQCTDHFATYVFVVRAKEALTTVAYMIAEDGDPAEEAARLAAAVDDHLRAVVAG